MSRSEIYGYLRKRCQMENKAKLTQREFDYAVPDRTDNNTIILQY